MLYMYNSESSMYIELSIIALRLNIHSIFVIAKQYLIQNV